MWTSTATYWKKLYSTLMIWTMVIIQGLTWDTLTLISAIIIIIVRPSFVASLPDGSQ